MIPQGVYEGKKPKYWVFRPSKDGDEVTLTMTFRWSSGTENLNRSSSEEQSKKN